ncbi:MAG: hypothetical protein H6607_04245 [Flavobacteriales bacterium]|nr:hypothetical protein [Flavobacteriales bacterium]
MIISKIKISNCLYYHLHAEQTITSAFVDNGNIGISEQLVNETTLIKIIEDYSKEVEDKPEVVVLNFENINAIQNNQLSKISDLKSLNTNLVLINVKKELIKELNLLSLFNNENNIIDEDNNYLVFNCFETGKFQVSYSTQEIFKIHFLNLLKEKHIKQLEGEEKYHSSSSVYLSKWINIKKFISIDKEFFLYAIYNLAVKTYQKWFKSLIPLDNENKPILVCQNLNSSYITSILSTLLRTDIVILDQIGPINKMYSTLDSKIETNKKYIVVSDLVCLGTEIKIAKSLIEFLGGKYLGNVSIVRIQTIDPVYRSFEDAECVFVVDKESNKEIGYKISTALDI